MLCQAFFATGSSFIYGLYVLQDIFDRAIMSLNYIRRPFLRCYLLPLSKHSSTIHTKISRTPFFNVSEEERATTYMSNGVATCINSAINGMAVTLSHSTKSKWPCNANVTTHSINKASCSEEIGYSARRG